MNAPNLPDKPTDRPAIDRFLQQASQLSTRVDDGAQTPARLIFALDATASRQMSWDRACRLQSQMFLTAAHSGGIEVQLCYFRGLNDFRAERWARDTRDLLHTMNAVQCHGGYTQIERLLRHAQSEAKLGKLDAVVFIGDAIEESAATLCQLSGALGLLHVPLFLFQEGRDAIVESTFKKMAQLSGGAWAQFDETSANYLAELLAAVTTYASGGSTALGKLQTRAARDLLGQLPALPGNR